MDGSSYCRQTTVADSGRPRQVAIGVDQQLVVGLVTPLAVLAPDVLEVGGEAFVQPRLGPLAAGQQIAPPLVRQLVRDQAVDVVVERGPLVEQRMSVSVVALVFSMPPKMNSGTGSGCTRVGVGDADLLREEVDHLLRPGEAAAGDRLPARQP